MSVRETPAIQALKERFRQAAVDLAEALPLSVASLALRPAVGGPLDSVLTLGFDETPGIELPPMNIGEAAAQWFEANHKELVLDVRPEHARSEFYRPFASFGLRSAIVMPVFHGSELVGALTAGSAQADAFTKRHLKLLSIMAAQLASDFPEPEPAAAVVEVHEPAAPVAEPPAAREEGGSEAHVEADAIGRVREWDAVAEGLFGVSRDEAVGGRLAVFYHRSAGRLIGAGLVDKLTSRGRFTGRVVGFDADGMPILCEVELSTLRTPSGAHGFRGRFRRVESESLLPRAEIGFDLATPYTFADSLRTR